MNRVVAITGASSGIGEALATELGRRGDFLVISARSAEALARVARETGTRTHVVAADVTKRTDVERIRDEAIRTFGHLDVWINNAGRGILRHVLELTDEDLDEMFAINLRSALYGMQAVVPHFVERGRGHLVNISSFLARVPLAPPRSAYSAAKAALNALTANLRMDLRDAYPDIHVSLVMPDLVRTQFAMHARWSAGATPPSGSGATPQSAAEVAAIVSDMLDRPVSELYTNAASRTIANRYFEDVARFEAERH